VRKTGQKTIDWADYYDKRGILDELLEEPVDFSLDKEILRDILSKGRKRKLQNVTIKIDPLQLKAIRKLATLKSIPYQTLVRHWLSEQIKKELDLTG
jgi:predicted DNA binding CopG/RHH family protein